MRKLKIAQSVQMEESDSSELWKMLTIRPISERIQGLAPIAGVKSERRLTIGKSSTWWMSSVCLALVRRSMSRLVVLTGTTPWLCFGEAAGEIWSTWRGKSLSIVFGAFLRWWPFCYFIYEGFQPIFYDFSSPLFDNDSILNPATDLMINIVPEPFFYDTAMTIGVSFLIPAFCIFAGSILYWTCSVRNRKRKE
ncbi:MAG: DUF1461 domain-containing protein [Clostridia bacterium]